MHKCGLASWYGVEVNLRVMAGVEEARAGRWGMDVGSAGRYMTAKGGADTEKEVKKVGPDWIPEDILEGVVEKKSWVGREVMSLVVKDKM
ncbi:hypothetical protein L211DRAFT_841346 [Terfezia boudieri ATCC MYA-4762]|uniref:Uncharacterized protein n=1 Tax=Terfezia boudieri ATCC MYA-4762 TaxID=1051890 RepID=A0A3N4LD86_9PEZI|nr:hypothetical protein L211DRAFT_841346 [Terfezia boudieri ATCC MYA-4762]